jgi:hypothetical protein
MVSIMPSLVALFSGAKTLVWTLKKIFENNFKNLGKVSLSQVQVFKNKS